MPARPPPKPWPMKWIVIAILVFVPIYTYLTVHFRRSGRVYEPYAEARDRAMIERLLAAGYRHRVTISATRPTEPLRASARAPIGAAPGGLPADLATALTAVPLPPARVTHIAAARETSTAQPYIVDFTATLPDEKEELLDAQIYVREDQLVLVPNFERVPGGLLVRSPETEVRLTVPAGILPPGRYRVTLVATHESQTWALSVK
ncbi:MAG TPA: hypothetical protein VNW30_12195 [Opitutaceae bacterium]|jgi:hypothetical protein|nr:hypothetical protein [Opitutaceae bacterium]